MSANEDFDEDPRYQLSAKGAAFFALVYLALAAISFALAFTFGTRPAEDMGYILGFPDWVFWILIIWQVCIVVIMFLMVRFGPYFKDIPLTVSGADEEDAGEEGVAK